MQKLAFIDKWLLAILIPACLGAYALHVDSVMTRDLANAAIYAAPPEGHDPYPTVGGFYPESREDGLGLEVGDRLLRVDGIDLSGIGYARFDGLLLEQFTGRKEVAVDFERNGEAGTASLRAIPYPMPWHRFPMLVSLFAVGTLVMLRGRNRRQARIAFIGFLSLSIVLAQFRGGPSWMTELGLYVRWLGLPVAFFFGIASMMTIPDPEGRPTRAGLLLCLAVALFSFLMRAGYHLGGPLPPDLTPRGALLSDVFFMIVVLAAPRWRRFPRSVPLACFLAIVPMVLGSILPVFAPDANLAAPFHAVGYFAVALIPVVFISRIAMDGLFDVDRVLSAAATYTVLVAVAIGAFLGLIPTLAMGLSAATGIAPHLAQWTTALGLALIVVPVTPWLRARVEQFFFPERSNFAQGIDALRLGLGACERDEEVLTLLGRDLERLLRVRHASAYLRRGAVFIRCFSNDEPDADGPGSEHSIDARTPERSLRGVTSAILLDGTGMTSLDLLHHEELSRLGIRVLLPVRRGAELVGFVCLGEKFSGDAFRDLELSRLTAVADRASARLELVRSEHLASEVAAADKEILSRSRFMARASHDLRQPLQALSLFAETLARRQDGEQTADLARKIGRSTEALREMFEGLLDLSRIEAGRLEPRRVAVSLSPLFERLASESSAVAAEKGLRLRVVPTSLSVESDPALLGRILQNLVVNAIRYTERGDVLIGARRSAGEVRIDVVDTGPGIPVEYQEQIFREFERGDTQHAISDEGLGLGLAIVSRLAEELDHSVELVSEVGRGTRFSVRARRCQNETAKPAREDAMAHQVAGLDGRPILVVDDDATVREASRVLLESWGCRVALAGSIAAVPAAIATLGGRVDAIIADYRLAHGETGTQAVRAAHARLGVAVPVIYVTGDSAQPREMQTEDWPILSKPLAPARLRSVLVHWLRRSADQDVSASTD